MQATGLGGVAQARSDVHWSIGVGVPGVVVGASSAPLYYAPPPPVDEYGNPLPTGDGFGDEENPLQRAGQALRDFFGGDPARRVPPPEPPPPPPPPPAQ